MAQNFAAEFFPKNFAKTERRRSDALQRPLGSEQIASLLSMRFNREPLYKSINDFYTPEYAQAAESGVSPAELAKLPKYRHPTDREVNLLYSDVHSKEQMYEVTGGQPAQ